MSSQQDLLFMQIAEVRRQADECRDIAVVNVLDACRDHIARSHVPEPGDPLVALTARQAEVVMLRAKGYSNAEIMQMLGIAKQTLDTTLRNAWFRLGIKTDVELVLLLVRHGVLVP